MQDDEKKLFEDLQWFNRISRTQLENIILFLDREKPNIELALQVARETFERIGGPYR